MIYNPNRLEWHLDDEATETPQGTVWSCKVAGVTFGRFNRLAAALAKSQDHRASCGVFAFGQPDAVRRWSGQGYPATRASHSGDGGRIPRAGWLKQSGIVQCDGMAPESTKHRAKPVLLR